VGLVWGRVLGRFGDVFGPSVNLASRLTGLAAPAEVLVDRGTADALQGHHGLSLIAQGPTTVPGVGPVTPFRLVRAPEVEAKTSAD
jgi:adenylate cyclase